MCQASDCATSEKLEFKLIRGHKVREGHDLSPVDADQLLRHIQATMVTKHRVTNCRQLSTYQTLFYLLYCMSS
jgi:hypothetical protein